MQIDRAFFIFGNFFCGAEADRAPSFGHAATAPSVGVPARSFGYSSLELNAPEGLRFLDGLFSPHGGRSFGHSHV